MFVLFSLYTINLCAFISKSLFLILVTVNVYNKDSMLIIWHVIVWCYYSTPVSKELKFTVITVLHLERISNILLCISLKHFLLFCVIIL